MKLTHELTKDHQVSVVAEFGAEAMNVAKEKAGRKIAKKVKIKGFRPGKAPYSVVLRHVGEGAILEEAFDILLEEEYPKMIEELAINPYGPGSLDEIESMDPPVFKFHVPLAPEVTLGEYDDIRIKYSKKRVTKKDVAEVIDSTLSQKAELEDVDRAAAEDDQVYVVIDANRVEPDEDGKTEMIAGRKLPVIIAAEDKQDENEWPYPGFGRSLIAASVGDKVESDYTYPEDYEFEEMRGSATKFVATVEEVKARVIPELTDELAKELSGKETVKEWEEDVKASLQDRAEAESNEEYNEKIMKKILKDADVKFPPQMFDHEFEHYIEDLKQNLQYQGMDLDTYLKAREMDMDALKEEVSESINDRITHTLVLMEIAQKEGVNVSDDEMNAIVQQNFMEMLQYLTPEQAQEYLKPEMMQNIAVQLMNTEIMNRTYARLRAIAKGEVEAEAEKAAEEGNEEPVVADAESKDDTVASEEETAE